jgi:elongation of very long chain fatty acids protein 6
MYIHGSRFDHFQLFHQSKRRHSTDQSEFSTIHFAPVAFQMDNIGFFWFTKDQIESGNWYWKFAPENSIISFYPWNHIFPFGSVALYIFLVWALPKIIKKPVPGIDVMITVWNFILWILSVVMTFGFFHTFYDYYTRVYTPLHAHLKYHSFFEFVCAKYMCYDHHFGLFWAYIFALSKYIELFDTVLIVLKHPEKPVDMLHWWHHMSVLLFTWYASMWRYGAGWYFMTMNAIIHSFMYFYYFLMSIGYKPTWAKLLTIGQISQMVIGTFINLYWIYLYWTGTDCSCLNPRALFISCAVMYASYFWLFLMFYLKRYNSPRTDTRGSKPIADSKIKSE